MSELVDFEGSIAHQDGCVVVSLRGDVDLASTVPFTALLTQALTASPHVVFDMADVTFLDSTGLRGILEALKGVGPGGSITIRNAPEKVVKVLRLSGVDGVLTVEP
jgi:anti-sigma B factor antagonist